MSKTELYLSKIVKYGLYAILLTPLLFWPRALFAFMTPKFILFQVLVEIVFGAWLILQLLKSDFSRSPTSKSPEVGLQMPKSDFRNYLFLALSGFITISFLSAIFGVDFGRSFWGIGARMTGLFAELHFFAWFLVLVDYFKNDRKEWNRYLNFSFAVSVLVALSAFYQNTDWRLVYGSTFFNNPTFVAPYLLFHFFWGLYQFSIFNFQFSSFKKWFFGAGTAFLGLVIFLGEIRGVILGLFIGLVIFGLGLIFAGAIKRRFKFLLFAFFVAIFIGLAGLWFARESAFVQNTSVLKRLTQVSLEQTTVQTRFIAWRLAIEGFKERILLGVGPENFNYVFNAHYNPTILKYGLGETWFDKPHNAFLEILTEIGAIGGLAYLLILITVAFTLFKLFKNGQKILVLTLASAFTAYLSSMFFSFDSFGSWFGLYLFLAFLASHNNANQNSELRMPRIANLYSQLASLAIILVTLALLYVNYGIWRANLYDADALRYFSRDPSAGVTLFKKSLSYWSPYQSEYQFDLIASVGGAVEKGVPVKNLEDTINFALGEADKAVAAHSQNASGYTDMLRIYNILGTLGRDPEILNQAELFGKKSLELSPNRQETLFYLARTALLKNNFKLAVQLAKQAVDTDPTINVSHWYLGLSYIADGQMNDGAAEIKKALEFGYQPKNDTEKNFIKSLGL